MDFCFACNSTTAKYPEKHSKHKTESPIKLPGTYDNLRLEEYLIIIWQGKEKPFNVFVGLSLPKCKLCFFFLRNDGVKYLIWKFLWGNVESKYDESLSKNNSLVTRLCSFVQSKWGILKFPSKESKWGKNKAIAESFVVNWCVPRFSECWFHAVVTNVKVRIKVMWNGGGVVKKNKQKNCTHVHTWQLQMAIRVNKITRTQAQRGVSVDLN